MEEPSILDYLKAKLTPWRGKAPEIPPLEREDSLQMLPTQGRRQWPSRRTFEALLSSGCRCDGQGHHLALAFHC